MRLNYLQVILSDFTMKKYTLLCALVFFSVSINTTVNAETKILSAKSPEHRVSLLELYTSEGCSSCPPADEFLSGLQHSGVTNNQLIPLAFHVTYWDFIGWKDPYATSAHDDKQRKTAQLDKNKTIYTPQFVLNGSDYRDYENFSSNVRKVILQLSKVALTLNATNSDAQTKVDLATELLENEVGDVAYYVVLYENKLVSDIKDGENNGKTLHHDYVVRKIHGPFIQNKSNKSASFQQVIQFESDWKRQDLGLVAYAQSQKTGMVLQTVDLKLF